MKTSFTVSTTVPAEPERVFRAWLSTEGHAAMTGSPAKVEPRVGGTFSAWDGYITGKTLKLQPYSRIVQSWRTSEFAEADPDSQIEIVIEPARGGALLTLTHSNIPEGQAESYESGWEESYFAPMREYFGDSSEA
jgi:activator of HSP90 ATPase